MEYNRMGAWETNGVNRTAISPFFFLLGHKGAGKRTHTLFIEMFLWHFSRIELFAACVCVSAHIDVFETDINLSNKFNFHPDFVWINRYHFFYVRKVRTEAMAFSVYCIHLLISSVSSSLRAPFSSQSQQYFMKIKRPSPVCLRLVHGSQLKWMYVSIVFAIRLLWAMHGAWPMDDGARYIVVEMCVCMHLVFSRIYQMKMPNGVRNMVMKNYYYFLSTIYKSLFSKCRVWLLHGDVEIVWNL